MPDLDSLLILFTFFPLFLTIFRSVLNQLVSRVTAGRENVLHNYVLVEVGEGLILAPPSLQSINSITVAFQKASILIHNILQNSLR